MKKLTAGQREKKNKGLCVSPYCMKPHAPNRNICYMHYQRRVREINPIFYTFNNLRCNAKRRGKQFDLTLAEFKELIKGTGYMENKGRHSHELQIDRKLEGGYSFENCRIITAKENLRRRYVDEKILEYERQKLEGKPITFNPDYL